MTHGIPTSFSVITPPLAYRFKEVVIPTLTYNVYYKGILNNAWYSKSWQSSTAYGVDVPPYPQANETNSITLPPVSLEGSAVLEIGLTGKKEISDYDNWQNNTDNAITYISGMAADETGGTSGQGNSPSYRIGIQAQRYATVNMEETTNVTGGFIFTKTDANTGKPVPGAEYKLYKEDNTAYADSSFTTDENGIIKQGALAPGKYYLKEIKAPNGYAINTEPVLIEISDLGSTTTLTGGVDSFQHDNTNPTLNASWGTVTAASGVWNKTTSTTKETTDTLNSDAILTNKGNVGFKTLTALTVQPESDTDNYNIENVNIVVKVEGTNDSFTYTSDANALAGINKIVTDKKLTGDMTIDYSCTFAQDESAYLEVGQTEQPLTPTDLNTPTDQNTTTDQSTNSVPPTGDNVNLTLWFSLFVLSAFLLYTCGLIKKRNAKR